MASPTTTLTVSPTTTLTTTLLTLPDEILHHMVFTTRQYPRWRPRDVLALALAHPRFAACFLTHPFDIVKVKALAPLPHLYNTLYAERGEPAPLAQALRAEPALFSELVPLVLDHLYRRDEYDDYSGGYSSVDTDNQDHDQDVFGYGRPMDALPPAVRDTLAWALAQATASATASATAGADPDPDAAARLARLTDIHVGFKLDNPSLVALVDVACAAAATAPTLRFTSLAFPYCNPITAHSVRHLIQAMQTPGSPFCAVSRMDLTGLYRVDNATFQAWFKAAPHLEDLTIVFVARLTDATVQFLVDTCVRLKALTLTFCSRLTSASLAALAASPTAGALESLSLGALGKLNDDQSLDIAPGLSLLAQATGSLTSLTLSPWAGLTDEDVVPWLVNNPALTTLSLARCPELGQATLDLLADPAIVPALTSLNLLSCDGISTFAIGPVIDAHPQLRELRLDTYHLDKKSMVSDLVAKAGFALRSLSLGRHTYTADELVDLLTSHGRLALQFLHLDCKTSKVTFTLEQVKAIARAAPELKDFDPQLDFKHACSLRPASA